MSRAEQAAKTYRGTWEEIALHREEIPADAILELTVVEPAEPAEAVTMAESLADLLEEAQHIEREAPIQYEDPYETAVLAQIREKFRRQGFEG
jgi:hypothetical protein